MGDQPAPSDTERLVQRVLRGLEQRTLLDPGDQARSALEANLLKQLDQLQAALAASAVSAPSDTVPPRRVGVAMALALHSQPHLAATLGTGRADGTTVVEERGPYPAEAPFVSPPEVMETALGVSQWELDDLREEVDRRAGNVLKQRRAVTWLWSHFGLPGSRPGPLYRVLFPGQDRRATSIDLLRRGGRLAVVVDGQGPPMSAMYLDWLGELTSDVVRPLEFRARYVDPGLRRALSRGVGADLPEVDRILDRMVVTVPRDGAVPYLERDQWRVTGLAALTTLGEGGRGDEPTGPVDRDELEWGRWLAVKEGEIAIGRAPGVLFDEFALGRAQAVLRHVYAGLLARVEQIDEGDEGWRLEDLELFDVVRHLKAALEPLVAWGRSEATHTQLAARLRLEKDAVKAALEPLADAWEVQLRQRWLAPSIGGKKPGVAAIVFAHLVALRGSLVRVSLREPDRRWEHRSLCLLFAGHYLAEAPLERLWHKGLSDMLVTEGAKLPPPEDIVGCWFWSVWQRVLDATDEDSALTLVP